MRRDTKRVPYVRCADDRVELQRWLHLLARQPREVCIKKLHERRSNDCLDDEKNNKINNNIIINCGVFSHNIH